MGRGKLKRQTVRNRSLDKAAEWLKEAGLSVDILDEIKRVGIVEPAETRDDKLREAESVYLYFSTQGANFKEKECKNCGKIFAYNWNVDSISNCSIECAANGLKQIGITWNPSKSQNERWGRYAPAVVPPDALEILKDLLNDPLEDQPSDIPQSEDQ